jgi:hypothetical protein
MAIMKDTDMLTKRQGSLLALATFISATIAITILLRTLFLSLIPSGFNWDETAYAYNAYSLLHFGVDEYGRRTPLFLESFGDYKPALLSYYLAGVFSVLSPSVEVSRLAMLPISLLGLFGVFLLSKKYRSIWFSLFLVLLISITPWHIHFSRAVMDPILGFSFFFLGWGLLVQSRKWTKAGGIILLLLAMYTYNAQRLLVPGSTAVWLLWHFGQLKQPIRKFFKTYNPEITAFLLQIIILLALIFSTANARANAVLLFNEPKYLNLENETVYRAAASGWSRLHQLNELPTTSITDAVGQYFLHLQPDFLFFGKTLGPRHSFSHYGLILPVFLPLIVIGLWTRKKNRHDDLDLLMLSILLITPGISALTNDVPHSGRTLAMVVPLMYFACLGSQYLVQLTRRNRLLQWGVITLSALAIIGNTSLYLRDLYLFYPEESSASWQKQMESLYEVIANTQITATKWHVDIEEDPRIFMAWYGKLHPQEVHPVQNPQNLAVGEKTLVIHRYSQEELACLFLTENEVYVGMYGAEDAWSENYHLERVATISAFNRFHPAPPLYGVYKTGITNPNLTKLCEQATLPLERD